MISYMIRQLAKPAKPRRRSPLKTNERKMRRIIKRELKPITPLKRRMRR